MKWKTKKYIPKEGDIRTKRKFAWLPKDCDGDMTVWLETYESVQVYRTRKRSTKAGLRNLPGWDEIRRLYLVCYS